MTIDATFWVTISFFIFFGILIYFKIPQKIKETLEQNILNIKNQINEAEKLKEDAKNILTEHEKKISNSKKEVKEMISKATAEAEKNVIKTNEEFHILMDSRKKNAEERIRQLKNEVREMIDKANEEAEKNVIRVNKKFHDLMENRKKNAEERIRQLKNQAEKDIKNASVKIAIESVEKLIKNSLDKSKLDKIYTSSMEETKLALKKKSS